MLSPVATLTRIDCSGGYLERIRALGTGVGDRNVLGVEGAMWARP